MPVRHVKHCSRKVLMWLGGLRSSELPKKVEDHEVPFFVASEDVNYEDILCFIPRRDPKQKVWLNLALQSDSGPPAVYAFGYVRITSQYIRGYNLIQRVKPALHSDDGLAFVDCVKRCLVIERALAILSGSTFSKHKLLALICTHRAGNCARALVLGQAGFFLDEYSYNLINRPLKDAGLELHPLHLAAQNLSSSATLAFLLAGADPNLCSFHEEDGDHDDITILPLSLALEALRLLCLFISHPSLMSPRQMIRLTNSDLTSPFVFWFVHAHSCNQCVTDWSMEKSVMKLIYILCLPELKESLDTIRMLASRTELVEKLSLLYAEKGQVVQLTALLLVAWNKLVTPYVEVHRSSVECCPIGRCIIKQLQSLSSSSSNQQSTTTAHCNCPSSDLLVKLQAAWKMLNLLESNYH